MVSSRVKSVLDKIIDHAYAREREFRRAMYKDFKISIIDRHLNSKNGDYDERTQTIRVVNPEDGAERIAKTCLHELAHHIDYVKNGKTGHQKPFYAVYARLIYSALDLHVIEKKDFEAETMHRSRDYSKVQQIIKAYVPSDQKTKSPDYIVVLVRSSYEQKDTLKEKGFKWDPIERAWSIVAKKDQEEAITQYLKTIGCNNYSVSNYGLKIDVQHYVSVTGDTYPYREILKSHGFRFVPKDKSWIKYHDSRDMLLNELDAIRKEIGNDDVIYRLV